MKNLVVISVFSQPQRRIDNGIFLSFRGCRSANQPRMIDVVYNILFIPSSTTIIGPNILLY